MEEGRSTAVILKSSRPRPPRKPWSLVWNDFTKERRPDGTCVAVCNHCKKELSASSRSGTTHLKNHLITCTTVGRVDGRKTRKKLIVRRPSLFWPGYGKTDTPSDHSKFNQDQSRHDLARMIVLHQYPLTIADDPGFRDFVRNLQPQFKPLSPDTVKEDCLRIYETGRVKLYEALGKVTSRFSLTADTWRSGGDVEYTCLTCHYVDNDWKLQSKVLNLLIFEALSTAEDVTRVIMEKLYDWSIHRKLSSVVLDNLRVGDEVAVELVNFLHRRDILIQSGEMFHLQSHGRILNFIVQDGLAQISEVIDWVRESVKFVRSSPLVLRTFQEIAKEVNAPQKPLILDVATSWTSTYAMLAIACEFQAAFMQLGECGNGCLHLLSTSEWDDVKAINECLDVFYQLMKKFSAFANPTANLYFVDFCGIHLLLKSWCSSQIPVVVLLGSHILKGFEHYWGMTRMMMAIASILDPRYKMKSIEYFFKLIYDGECEAVARIEEIRKGLINIYNEYVVHSTHTSDSQALLCYTGSDSGCSKSQYEKEGVVKTSSRITLFEARKGLDQYLYESSSSQSIKTDLDMYLEEAVHHSKEGLDDNFNVLAWWKVNAPKYPILSMMARDILATPISIVPLDMKGRTLHPYMTSMDPATVESLVCAHDWLRDELEASNLDIEVCMLNTNADEVYPLLQ